MKYFNDLDPVKNLCWQKSFFLVFSSYCCQNVPWSFVLWWWGRLPVAAWMGSGRSHGKGWGNRWKCPLPSEKKMLGKVQSAFLPKNGWTVKVGVRLENFLTLVITAKYFLSSPLTAWHIFDEHNRDYVLKMRHQIQTLKMLMADIYMCVCHLNEIF